MRERTQKLVLLFIIYLIPTIVFSQKIKSITEFLKDGDRLTKIRTNYYNTNKLCYKSIYFIGFDSITNSFKEERCYLVYNNNRKQSESCFIHYLDIDSIAPSGHMVINYNDDNKEKTLKFYSKDSSLYSMHKKSKNTSIETNIQYLWWNNKTNKKPKIEDAIVIIDTFELDEKKRWLKRKHWNSEYPKETYLELYEYNKNGYLLHKKSSSFDTIIHHHYNKLQRIIDREKVEYEFSNSDNYTYSIEYY